MAYSERAKELRRCTYRYPEGHDREGERCKAWAMWGHPEQLCVAHGRDGERGPYYQKDPSRLYRTIPLCECEAYNFPHRPGGGLCQWPDPPQYRLTTPEGTSTGRGIGGFPWTDRDERNVISPETVRLEAEKDAGETDAADQGAGEPAESG